MRALTQSVTDVLLDPDHITFDIIFKERANFEKVRDAKVLSPQIVAGLLRIPLERVTDFVVFEPANAIKFTIRRERPSGSPGERDVFGSQQYAPLFDVEVP